MSEVVNFPDRSENRRIIERSIKEIRATGWYVQVAIDHGESVVVDVFDGEGTTHKMTINPREMKG